MRLLAAKTQQSSSFKISRCGLLRAANALACLAFPEVQPILSGEHGHGKASEDSQLFMLVRDLSALHLSSLSSFLFKHVGT